MNFIWNALRVLKKPTSIILVVVVVGGVILAVLSYRLVMQSPAQSSVASSTPTAHNPRPTASPTAISATPTPLPIILPVQPPAAIQGIEVAGYPLPGLSWLRIAHPSCGGGNQSGDVLKKTVQTYHSQGIRVLLTLCQGSNDNSTMFNDAAQGYADAVQCGNEEMKQDVNVSFLYMAPEQFAKFYNACEQAVHAVNPATPTLLGSLDPHVAADDYQLLINQVNYLDRMQTAMNTTVHPGGNWDWHNQVLGLINSWHDGYLDSNNLAGLFDFWAQQFHVDTNGGQLGKHLWVVEGTGCFKGCGVDTNSPAQIAIAHILALITDVQTSQQAQVPFFFFSGSDFNNQGVYWPIGVLDAYGNAKPIRQDLPMGARQLTLTCSSGTISVSDQEQLLAKLYNHCTLPSNYVSILTS